MANTMANTNHLRTGGRLVALLVASLLLLEPAVPLLAEPLPSDAPPQSLQIVILEGEGALNNISERTAREPIVQVQDENHKPLAGAVVLFAIHGGTSGAGAGFAGGASSLSVVTDASGMARAVGLLPNQVQGSWQIQVTAHVGKLTASTTINQSNVVPSPQAQNPPSKPPSHWPFSKPVTIGGGILAVGVIVAVVVLTSNNNGTTISTGPGTVGPPTGGAAVRPGIRIHF
jgi:hypothetical protein